MQKIFSAKLNYLLIIAIALLSTGFNVELRASFPDDEYACLPCGQSCDKTVYSNVGSCSHCHMPLVKKSGIRFKNIEPSEVCAYIRVNPKIILLDVRTKAEFEGKVEPELGTLKHAINIPVQELESKIALLTAYKDREIIVYCSRSHRSPRASYILNQNGFTKVINLSGGMSMMRDSACKDNLK